MRLINFNNKFHFQSIPILISIYIRRLCLMQSYGSSRLAKKNLSNVHIPWLIRW